MERRLAHSLLVIVAFVALAWLLCACSSLVPTTRSESAATRIADNAATKASTEFAGRVEFEPQPTVVVIDGEGRMPGRVEVRPAPRIVDTTASAHNNSEARSRDAVSSMLSVSIPLGVRLVLIGLGLIVVLIALRLAYSYVRKTAFGLAVSKADAMLSAKIRSYRARAIDSNATPDDKAFYATEIAEIESERGKLAASTKEAK